MINLLTPREVGAALSVSPKTVPRMARAGKIPSFRIDRKIIRFDTEAVERWLKKKIH